MKTPECDPPETETATERIKGVLKDLVGLPPGDGTPRGEGRPANVQEVPRGALTSDDAEGLTPHAGTGIAVDE